MEQRKYLINLQKIYPENKKCIDCSNSTTTFIDLNYGSFLCTICAELHRELGSDYCVVKSISLDNLTNDQLKIFKETKGNVFVNLEYEAVNKKEIERLKPKPGMDIQFAKEFIKRKYKFKQFYKKHIIGVEQLVKHTEPNLPIISHNTKQSKTTQQTTKNEKLKMPMIVDDLIKFDKPMKKYGVPINSNVNKN